MLQSTQPVTKFSKGLEPYEDAIRGRHDHAVWKISQLTQNGKRTLSDFADGHLYFGLHRTSDGGWVFREWAPHATDIHLIGDFNGWKKDEAYRCKRLENGNWELKLPADKLKHGDLYKMNVRWDNGEGERIPAWAQRVVQDDKTKIFSAQVWNPEQPHVWHDENFKIEKSPLLIYICRVQG